MKKLVTICLFLACLIAPVSSENDMAFLSIVWETDLGIGSNPEIAMKSTHPSRVSLYKDPTDVFGYLGTFNWDGEEKKFAVSIAHILGAKKFQYLLRGTFFVFFYINGEQVLTEWIKPESDFNNVEMPVVTIPQTAPTEKVIVQVVIHDERPSGIYLHSIKFPLCPAWTVSNWDDTDWDYYSRGDQVNVEVVTLHDTTDIGRVDTIYKNVFVHDTIDISRVDTVYKTDTLYETIYEAVEYIYVHDTIDRYKDITIFEYGTDWRGLPANIQNVVSFVNPPVYYDLQGHKWLRYEDTPIGVPLIEISGRGYVRFIRKQ